MMYKLNLRHHYVIIFRAFLIFALLLTIIIQSESLPLKKATAATVSATLQDVESLNKQQKYETSISILLNALSKHPNSESLIITFKQTFALHLYQQISSGFERIAQDKHDTEAYLSIARSYGLMGEQVKAMETLLDGTIDNPGSPKLWMAIGAIELQSHRNTEALSVFQEIIRIDHTNADAYNNIAYILAGSDDANLKDLNKALPYAIKATSLDPNNPNFLDTLAEIKFQMGQKQEAISLINEAINLAPNEDYFKKQFNKFK